MKCFDIARFEIGNGLSFAGHQWPEALDRFIRGLETEEEQVCAWPRLQMIGGHGELVNLRLENQLGGLYAYGTGGELADPFIPDKVASYSGHDRNGVLATLKLLLANDHGGVRVDLPDFSGQSQIVIFRGTSSLVVGHRDLPTNLAVYGTKVNGLRPKALAPVRV